MNHFESFLEEHRELTRRYFLKFGVVGAASATALMSSGSVSEGSPLFPNESEKTARFGSYLTPDNLFGDVSRGDPVPHTLPEEKREEVGLSQDSWQLEIISDPDHPVRLGEPRTKEDGTAVDFKTLMKLAESKAVRFPKIMTCLNLGCPLGMGIWEGVPLRDVIALAEPRKDVRRVVYYGYHNDDPEQMFRSSLPMGRVYEDYFNLPPVIACYKLNGRWLSEVRGGPVRIVVPEAYGFKSIKWLSHVVLTNLPHANDTYAEQGNDVDSPMKTFAATIDAPRQVKAGTPIELTGYAQVGIGGLSKVQVWLERDGAERPKEDTYFSKAPWIDMDILEPPNSWGGGLPDDKIPGGTYGFDADTGRPRTWPMRFCAAHWAGVHPGLERGEYTLRCRSVDQNGVAQPLPRPLRNSGRSVIEQISVDVV